MHFVQSYVDRISKHHHIMCIIILSCISVRYHVVYQKVNSSSLCGGDTVDIFRNVFVLLKLFLHLFILIFNRKTIVPFLNSSPECWGLNPGFSISVLWHLGTVT